MIDKEIRYGVLLYVIDKLKGCGTTERHVQRAVHAAQGVKALVRFTGAHSALCEK